MVACIHVGYIKVHVRLHVRFQSCMARVASQPGRWLTGTCISGCGVLFTAARTSSPSSDADFTAT